MCDLKQILFFRTSCIFAASDKSVVFCCYYEFDVTARDITIPQDILPYLMSYLIFEVPFIPTNFLSLGGSKYGDLMRLFDTHVFFF